MQLRTAQTSIDCGRPGLQAVYLQNLMVHNEYYDFAGTVCKNRRRLIKRTTWRSTASGPSVWPDPKGEGGPWKNWCGFAMQAMNMLHNRSKNACNFSLDLKKAKKKKVTRLLVDCFQLNTKNLTKDTWSPWPMLDVTFADYSIKPASTVCAAHAHCPLITCTSHPPTQICDQRPLLLHIRIQVTLYTIFIPSMHCVWVGQTHRYHLHQMYSSLHFTPVTTGAAFTILLTWGSSQAGYTWIFWLPTVSMSGWQNFECCFDCD